MTTVLELRGIRKRFGSAIALDGADFVLARGEVHGRLGETGAGKSTLMHLAFGLLKPDDGTIGVRGQTVAFRDPAAAKRLGIGMVHQHFTSIPALTVEENLWLAAGRYGSAVGTASGAGNPDTALGRLRRRLWEGLDPGALAEALPVGAKQRLEILQALATDAEILLLDEPTAVLAPPEVAELLALLAEFARGGGSVVFITHKLDEVLAVAGRVTVLRGGRVSFSGPVEECTSEGLARAMVGEAPRVPLSGTVVPLALAPGGSIVARIADLELRGGEILGLAAVEGNGQRELLRSLIAPGTAFVPEDRTTEGLIGGFSLTENLVLGLTGDPRWVKGRWLNWPAAGRRMDALLTEFGIHAGGSEAPARSLSGGNQQKVVLARWLSIGTRVFILDEPTRGIDVGSKAEIYQIMADLADQGVAILMISSELPEVLGMSDRVLVMREGRIAKELSRAEASEEVVMSYAVGGAAA